MIQNKVITHKPLFICGLSLAMALTGCATTSPTQEKTDPWIGWNQGALSFNDNIDKVILKPVAKGYQWITPTLINEGVTNFFSNIKDVGVTINDLLQFKINQGGMDARRLLVNSTAGVAGFVDVAKLLDLPKHQEDFGQTLSVWGVPSGSYLVLPFFGPSNPRDALGIVGDALFNPLTYVSAFGTTFIGAAIAGSKAVDVVDRRANLMTTEKIINEGSVNRYEFIKNSYEQNRDFLINDGNSSQDVDLLDDNTDAKAKTGNSTPSTQNKNNTDKSVSDSNKIKTNHSLELTTPK
jgi:phospholipid-binding lipoprotein MlaA